MKSHRGPCANFLSGSRCLRSAGQKPQDADQHGEIAEWFLSNLSSSRSYPPLQPSWEETHPGHVTTLWSSLPLKSRHKFKQIMMIMGFKFCFIETFYPSTVVNTPDRLNMIIKWISSRGTDSCVFGKQYILKGWREIYQVIWQKWYQKL